MEKHWLSCQGEENLLVIVLGWAADWKIVEHIQPKEFDVVCLYDYRQIATSEELSEETFTKKYKNRYLFAWSFGVWVAENIFAGQRFDHSVAFNGTPFPVDKQYGIDPRVMEVTIRGLERGGMEQFNRRTYGQHYDRFESRLSTRSLEDNIAELRNLQKLSVMPYSPSIEWDKAIVGSEDSIFPPQNMKCFWGDQAQILPLPHYPFADSKQILEYLEER